MTLLAISSGGLAAIVIIVVVDLFAIMFGLSFMRARKEQRAAAEAAAAGFPIPPAEATKKPRPDMTRREFFRKALVASFLLFGAQFGAGTIAFLWPNLKGGFGAVINAGKLTDIKATIDSTREPFYVGAGRFYIVPYSGRATPDADYLAEKTAAEGIMPLYQRCVHLGCRVPFCARSQWFECPCHGSKYSRAGEYRLGPAPRGMDRFQIEVTSAGDVMVDTSVVILGPPRGTDTTGQNPEGGFCVATA